MVGSGGALERAGEVKGVAVHARCHEAAARHRGGSMPSRGTVGGFLKKIGRVWRLAQILSAYGPDGAPRAPHASRPDAVCEGARKTEETGLFAKRDSS